MGMCCLVLVAYLISANTQCNTVGTDYWHEVCMDEGEVDLSGDQEPIEE